MALGNHFLKNEGLVNCLVFVDHGSPSQKSDEGLQQIGEDSMPVDQEKVCIEASVSRSDANSTSHLLFGGSCKLVFGELSLFFPGRMVEAASAHYR